MTQIKLLRVMFTIWMASAELTVNKGQPSETASQCLLHIINKYFSESKKVAVRYNDDQRQMSVLEDLFKHTSNPIMVNADEHPMGARLDKRMPSDTTIILSEGVNLTEYLESNLYTARTVFFTVFWRKGTAGIGKVFAAFWNYYVVNAYALEIQEDEINVYECIPYMNCKVNEPILLDKWSEGGFRYDRMDRIKEKTPIRQVNGCTLVVTVPHVPPTIIYPKVSEIHGTNMISGSEGRMWMTVSEKVNSTFRYKVPDDGSLWGHVKHPSGAVGEVIQKKSQFAGGGPTIILERLSYLEAIVGTSGVSDTIVWIVPKGVAKGHPVWMRMFTVEFSLPTWICLAAILTVAVGVHFALSRSGKTSSLFDSFLVLFSASLRGSMKMPETRPLKVLIASWMWYSLIILTAYESMMRSTLTVPIHHNEVNTLREVVELGIDLYGIDTTIKVVLIGTNDPHKEALSKTVKAWNFSLEDILLRIARDKNSGYMREKLTIDYFLYKRNELVGRVHQVKEHVDKYYQTVYAAKRLPVFERVQSIVSHLRESGITSWWRSQYTRESYPTQTKAVKLTTEHMTVPFTILGLGSTVAVIAFVAEHSTGCKRRRTQQK